MVKSQQVRTVHLALLVLLVVALSTGCSLFRKDPLPVLLSSGKPYTIDPGQGLGEDVDFEWYFEQYHDLDGTKLTDGIVGAGYLDGNYVGFRWTDVDGEDNYIERQASIIIDLGDSHAIGSVRSHWSWDLTANIRYPDPLQVSVSKDGQTWSEPTSQPFTNPDEGGTPLWVSIPMSETGRYVKVEWTVRNAWYHVSEIEVYSPNTQ